EIRIFKKNEDDERQFIHSKCYIFTSESCKTKAYGIIGSSNFTAKGLQGNSELNYLECTPHIVRYGVEDSIKGHVGWFEDRWEHAEDWTKEFLEEVLKPSKIVDIINSEPQNAPDNPQLTPYEVYIKYLQTQFGDIVSGKAKERLTSYLPQNFDTLDYQLDAVQQCFYIMQQHGGFLLADVVGLGKTVVGVLIIKKFISEAALYNRNAKVLIVVPPAIKKAWIQTIEMFDLNAQDKISGKIEFITTGSIGCFVDDDGNDIFTDADVIDDISTYNDFGMIIIDESHNFRNSETQKYKALDALISSIASNTGTIPFVGLLSATPQNNSPRDLKNQIYLFQRSRQNSTLPVEGGKLDSFFSQMEHTFYQTRKELGELEKRKSHITKTQYDTSRAKLQGEIKAISAQIRQKVLDHITVRRTRGDIKKYYASDSANLRFPTVRDPEVLKYKMNAKLANLFANTVNCITAAANEHHAAGEQYIGYYRYCAISYLLSDYNRKIYSNRGQDVDTISKLLAGIMQTNLVKRLESSFDAFRESLKNLRQYTQNM
ncbi:MAG: DEAD/DEAH box helicase family protein, partial [Bacteroidales bacterium]|nr:DEAD/DEAH box helicase family protein [Bacteroidales bacterium]